MPCTACRALQWKLYKVKLFLYTLFSVHVLVLLPLKPCMRRNCMRLCNIKVVAWAPKGLSAIQGLRNRWMIDYLRVTLSPSKCYESKSAPVPKFSLADHQLRWAPNAKIGFIDGKVKAMYVMVVINRIISFLTKRACRRIIRYQCEETQKRVQDGRHMEKHHKINQREIVENINGFCIQGYMKHFK